MAHAMAVLPDISGGEGGILCTVFDDEDHISQTTIPLGISNVTGALIGFDAGFNLLNNEALPVCCQFSLDHSQCIAKAVTYKDVILAQVFLIHRFS